MATPDSLPELDPSTPRLKRFARRLFDPVDCASLVIFRVALGLIFLWEAWRYMSTGWIRTYYITPQYHFHYEGFSWIKPWDGEGMYIHFTVMGLAAFFMAIGFLWRFSAALHFVLFTMVYLMDQAKYLNHFYLACLINFLLIFMPANRALSVDAWLFPRLRRLRGFGWLSPNVPSETVPYWTIWSLRFQMGLVYLFAAIAKMNADWMLHGEPVGDWLDGRGNYVLLWDRFPIGDWVFDEPWAGMVFAWGGFMIDLLAWPLLVWRRTRPYMFLAFVFFHGMNKWLFNIGIFPVMALSVTTIFFEPGWPRRICLFFPPRETLVHAKDAIVDRMSVWQRSLFVGLLVYMTIQVILPLRHFLYPGTPHWTEEGHRFAWHMKLRDKSGRATFFIRDPASGTTWEMGYNRTTYSGPGRPARAFQGGQRRFLTRRQIRKMTTRPYLLHQFVHYLEGVWRENGFEDVEIRVNNECRLNFRDWQTMIDPTVDLTREKHSLWHKPWILPLETPFRPVADDDDDDEGDVPDAEKMDRDRSGGRVDDD